MLFRSRLWTFVTQRGLTTKSSSCCAVTTGCWSFQTLTKIPNDHINKTADWGYVRLRRVQYSKAELTAWSKRIKAQNWKKTFVFFKHEDEGTGPKLAAQFINLNK